MESLAREPGIALSFSVARPDTSPRGSILVLHGYGEHSGYYVRAVERWTRGGFLVASFDLRGHGRSGGARGHVRSFDEYVDDAVAMLDCLAAWPDWPKNGPPALFGHSLGGLIATWVALTSPHRVCGLGLSSPFFGLALRVPRYKLVIGNTLGRLFPRMSLPTGISPGQLSHDPRAITAIETDPLRVRRATAKWFFETLRAQAELEGRIGGLAVPALCLAAGDDHLADVELTRRLMEPLPGVTIQVIPGAYHEILTEAGGLEYMAAFGRHFSQWFRRPSAGP